MSERKLTTEEVAKCVDKLARRRGFPDNHDKACEDFVREIKRTSCCDKQLAAEVRDVVREVLCQKKL